MKTSNEFLNAVINQARDDGFVENKFSKAMASELLQARERIAELEKAQEWISVDERLPVHAQPVIAHYKNSHGKSRRVMAEYLVKFTEEWDGEDDDKCLDYDESVHVYYYESGWYECIDNWGDFTSIKITEGVVDSWVLRPAPPKKYKRVRINNMKTIDIRDEDKKPTHIKFCGTGDLVTYSNNYLEFYESGDDDNTALCDWDDFDNFIKACYKARELAGKDK